MGGHIGPYKMFVCLLGDCALVNTMLGIHYNLYRTPPLLPVAINIAQYVVRPRPPLFCHSTYNIGNANIV